MNKIIMAKTKIIKIIVEKLNMVKLEMVTIIMRKSIWLK